MGIQGARPIAIHRRATGMFSACACLWPCAAKPLGHSQSELAMGDLPRGERGMQAERKQETGKQTCRRHLIQGQGSSSKEPGFVASVPINLRPLFSFTMCSVPGMLRSVRFASWRIQSRSKATKVFLAKGALCVRRPCRWVVGYIHLYLRTRRHHDRRVAAAVFAAAPSRRARRPSNSAMPSRGLSSSSIGFLGAAARVAPYPGERLPRTTTQQCLASCREGRAAAFSCLGVS